MPEAFWTLACEGEHAVSQQRCKIDLSLQLVDSCISRMRILYILSSYTAMLIYYWMFRYMMIMAL